MDSEQELELDKKFEEVFESAIQSITNKDKMAQWTLFIKISFYIYLTLIFFIVGIFVIVKKIILFRFSQIPIEFKIMGKLDGFLKKHLMF